MSDKKLFTPIRLGQLTLSNSVAMAPMTRSRAVVNNAPTDLVAEYYAQRAGAGLLITEGTSPSINGLGYARIPGIFNQAQVAGWRKVADAVHAKGGHIFMQLMHTGRVSATINLPEGGVVVAPSEVILPGDMWTDAQGMQPHAIPRAMSTEEVKATIAEYLQAAVNAVEAGLDGVELHAANGYLIEQFLNPYTNIRSDEYGGSIENRSRFLLEIADGTIKAIGADKVGVRLSPHGAFNDMPAYAEVNEHYIYLAKKLNDLGIVYLHVLDHSSQGAPAVPAELQAEIRSAFKNTLILCGGFDDTIAEATLAAGKADIIAFGRPFISNPDLIAKWKDGIELTPVDFSTLYTADEKGYTDYPVLATA